MEPADSDYHNYDDSYIKENESLDKILPINVEMSYKPKREQRRLSLPVVDSGSGARLMANAHKSPVFQVGITNSFRETFDSSDTKVYPERRSTSMPEFYGLSELRAKHEKQRNRRRSRTEVCEQDSTIKLPPLSCSKSNNLKEDLLTPLRKKTFLPRIDPKQTKQCLTQNRKKDISDIICNPESMSNYKL